MKRSLFQQLVHRIASWPPGVWLFSRILHHLDRSVHRLTGGRTTFSSIAAGAPMVFVTTTGAKSGLARTVPLQYIAPPDVRDEFALIGTNWGREHYPAWYHNLKAHPQARCTFNGQTFAYQAHEAQGEEYDRYWQRAVQMYAGYTLYKQRIHTRRIPIMVLKKTE